MSEVEQDFFDRILSGNNIEKKFEPVGLREMCRYLTKFLQDESRYGNHTKQYKNYYRLASKYPNNMEKLKSTFGGKFKQSMVYGFVSSSLLEEIITTVLTEAEQSKAKRIIDELKNSGLSFDDYYQSKTEYDSNRDLFDQLSLVDTYIYYEMRMHRIQLETDEVNRSIDAINKRKNLIYKDPTIWFKV